jgi:hypothetical protein
MAKAATVRPERPASCHPGKYGELAALGLRKLGWSDGWSRGAVQELKRGAKPAGSARQIRQPHGDLGAPQQQQRLTDSGKDRRPPQEPGALRGTSACGSAKRPPSTGGPATATHRSLRYPVERQSMASHWLARPTGATQWRQDGPGRRARTRAMLRRPPRHGRLLRHPNAERTPWSPSRGKHC